MFIEHPFLCTRCEKIVMKSRVMKKCLEKYNLYFIQMVYN